MVGATVNRWTWPPSMGMARCVRNGARGHPLGHDLMDAKPAVADLGAHGNEPIRTAAAILLDSDNQQGADGVGLVGEVGREALPVRPLALRFGGPLAGPAASRRCLRVRLGRLGCGCFSSLKLLALVVVLGKVEGERDLGRVRPSRHPGTPNGRDETRRARRGDVLCRSMLVSNAGARLPWDDGQPCRRRVGQRGERRCGRLRRPDRVR